MDKAALRDPHHHSYFHRSGLEATSPYTEQVLATLLDRGLKPATAFSMNLILFNFVRGFATSLEMEATAEANTGVTADEWMDVQKPALEALLADRDTPAFRAVLDSFEPDGFDLDLDELFESGLSYLLDGFQRTTEMRFRKQSRN